MTVNTGGAEQVIIEELEAENSTLKLRINELEAFVRKCSRMTSLQKHHNEKARSLLPPEVDDEERGVPWVI